MIEKAPDSAVCADCGGNLVFRVWGGGVDSAVAVTCVDCGNGEIYP